MEEKETFLRKWGKWLGISFLVLVLVGVIYDGWSRGEYDENLGMNLMVVSERGVGLAIVRPVEDMVGWVELPSNMQVRVEKTGAVYPMASMWKFARGESHGLKLYRRSLGQTLGVGINKVVYLGNAEASVESVVGRLWDLALTTDLSLSDRWKLRQFLVTQLSAKKVLGMDVPDVGFEKVVEPDGKEFLVPNNVFGLWAKNKFVWDRVLGEEVEVAVNNISGREGAGMALAHQLEASGLRVIEVVADSARMPVSHKIDAMRDGCGYEGELKGKSNTEKVLRIYNECERWGGGDASGSATVKVWVY